MTDIETRDIPLNWEVFVTPGIPIVTSDLPPGIEQRLWSPISATLISGQRDAVLVDALMTVEQAHGLVEWVEAHGKNLTTIYLTHGHGDHFFGLGALLERFPTARALATPAVVKFMHQQASPASIANFWGALFPGQIPDRLVIAEELKGKVIELEGRDLVHPSAWWSLGTSPTTTFTSTSARQTRTAAASGSRRSTPLRRSTHAR